VVEEMGDRFGPLPMEVSNLISVMKVRLVLKHMGITRLDVGLDGLSFTFSPDANVKPERVVHLVGTQPRRFQFLSEKKLKVRGTYKNPFEGLLEAERVAKRFKG
jgi:transcription-repair coupling factor (superfamily II helicase)